METRTRAAFLSTKASLAIILIAVAALWAGVAGIGMNSDDFQYLPSLAPIEHIGDVLRPFLSPDANPSFFRPLANVTMSLDFLLFGWSGAAFHLTDLLFHLVATLLVFYFARDLFRLTEREALAAALIFGILASHEYNLVVDTARADMLAAIFVLLSFLLLRRARIRHSLIFEFAAIASFFLALCSKEIAITALPLLLVLPEERWDWMGRIRRMVPFVVVAILFYFYHAHFTTPIAESQPLMAAGAHNLAAFLRNGAYSIGYMVLPLDLAQATVLLTRYRTLTLLAGSLLGIAFLILTIAGQNRSTLRAFVMPVVFFLFTGSILFLTFERWRLYLPSVGAIAIVVLLVSRTPSRVLRMGLLAVLLLLGVFHIYRALLAQSEWRAATALRDRAKASLTRILNDVPRRPLTLGILASPSKLGGASVILLGESALVTRAEADRLSAYNHETASTAGTNVDSWTAVDVYALDRREGFRGLEVDSMGPERFLVSVPNGSSLILYPSGESEGAASRRDLAFQPGDSVVTPHFTDIIRTASAGVAKSIEVIVGDSTATLLTFRDSCFARVTR